ncbi:MAG TPA: helix-hairpin-helix domain-containing protein [Candidatus Acidoferrales bacterium]|jgi:DNA uptake protein ComE-like DNA-binding protein|nr:helix-hairpin-helix domain-containing protein [Candidatus Acidoferrales bacterium]
MKSERMTRVATALSFLLIISATCGCAPNETAQQRKEREDKTRAEVAKATDRAKPEIQAAGRELGRVADEAAREARAFAEGVRQGWVQGGHHVVNLNSASESELTELPDISSVTARRIIRNRPYHQPAELISKHVVSSVQYAKIKDIVTTE